MADGFGTYLFLVNSRSLPVYAADRSSFGWPPSERPRHGFRHTTLHSAAAVRWLSGSGQVAVARGRPDY